MILLARLLRRAQFPSFEGKALWTISPVSAIASGAREKGIGWRLGFGHLWRPAALPSIPVVRPGGCPATPRGQVTGSCACYPRSWFGRGFRGSEWLSREVPWLSSAAGRNGGVVRLGVAHYLAQRSGRGCQPDAWRFAPASASRQAVVKRPTGRLEPTPFARRFAMASF